MTNQQYEKMETIFFKIGEIEKELFSYCAYVNHCPKETRNVRFIVPRNHGIDMVFIVDNNDFVDFLKSQIDKKNKQIQDLKIELNNI